MRRTPLLAAILLSLVAAPATALDVDEAYRAIGKTRTAFDSRAGQMPRPEARFLEHLFELTDRTLVENIQVLPWFLSEGRNGLHFEVYHERVTALLASLEDLETPERATKLATLVTQAIRGQRDFLADWHRALEQGEPFSSQISDEFGYHEGLHRSHRRLLQAYSELLGLYEKEGDWNRRSFYDHLCALDLL